MGTHSPDGSLYFQNFQPLILRFTMAFAAPVGVRFTSTVYDIVSDQESGRRCQLVFAITDSGALCHTHAQLSTPLFPAYFAKGRADEPRSDLH